MLKLGAAVLGLTIGLTLSYGAAAANQVEIDSLARNVERAEAIRSVKTLQRSFAQYGQFGLWHEMGRLFADDGIYIWGDDTAKSPSKIGALLAREYGGGKEGLAPGAVHTQLIEQSIVNLSVDGNSAKGRWYGFLLLADGKGAASIQGGVFENNYVKRNGVWKIAELNFRPQYEGPYETGWTNWKSQDIPITPFHFNADEAGIPVPAPIGAAPHTHATLAELEQRAQILDDQNEVRNLQAAYGYYIDRRMWDDAVDLFTSDSVYELGSVGLFDGASGVRKVLERQGPPGLTDGVLNDRLQFDTIVHIAPGSAEAQVRGIELGLVGDTAKKQSHWEVNVFDNRFVKENGIWKIREMRVFPLFRSEYSEGWGKSRENQPPGAAPDHPLPASDQGDSDRLIPAFVSVNPVTGKTIALPPGYKLAAAKPLTRAIPAPAAVEPTSIGARLDEVARRLAVARAYDAVENLSSTYGDCLDDYQWPTMAGIFGKHGAKQIPFVGYYMGAERIAHALFLEWGDPQTGGRASISYHWRIQPVINIAYDGRSANLRTYLFQPYTAKEQRPGSAGLHGAMYPNDQLVLEDGIWRFWNLSLDEPYYTMPGGWKGGWTGSPLPTKPRLAASHAVGQERTVQHYFGPALIKKYPPDILISVLGKREEHYIGGTGETWNWPRILPMWFGYKNPVSGRTPELYLSDCVPCDYDPDLSMTRHGYLMPPTGPQPDKMN